MDCKVLLNCSHYFLSHSSLHRNLTRSELNQVYELDKSWNFPNENESLENNPKNPFHPRNCDRLGNSSLNIQYNILFKCKYVLKLETYPI